MRDTREALDDWLGDISDDDWDDPSRERAERTPPVYEEPPLRAEPPSSEPTPDSPAREVVAAEDHRALIERRRHVAGLAVVVVLALAAAILVLLLRGGDQAPTSITDATNTTPTPTETTPSPPPSTPPPSPSPPSTTTPSTPGASAFTLPEGTKLRRGEEGDPAVIEELQQALTAAGYDPGPVDGTYGRRTEAAVVAFQQDNDLPVDGVVGPDTAAALNDALADG